MTTPRDALAGSTGEELLCVLSSFSKDELCKSLRSVGLRPSGIQQDRSLVPLCSAELPNKPAARGESGTQEGCAHRPERTRGGMARGKGSSSNREPKAKRQRLKRKGDLDAADKLGSTVQPKRQRVRPQSCGEQGTRLPVCVVCAASCTLRCCCYETTTQARVAAQTIESARIRDETMVDGEDPALVADFADDEFAGVLSRELHPSSQPRSRWSRRATCLQDARAGQPPRGVRCAGYFSSREVPKVLLTTCLHPTRAMFDFLTDFMEMLPNAHFYKRRVRACPCRHPRRPA